MFLWVKSYFSRLAEPKPIVNIKNYAACTASNSLSARLLFLWLGEMCSRFYCKKSDLMIQFWVGINHEVELLRFWGRSGEIEAVKCYADSRQESILVEATIQLFVFNCSSSGQRHRLSKLSRRFACHVKRLVAHCGDACCKKYEMKYEKKYEMKKFIEAGIGMISDAVRVESTVCSV